MKFIKLPIIYLLRKPGEDTPKDRAYRNSLEELGIPTDDDNDEEELHGIMYIQDTALRDVAISQKITRNNKLIPSQCVLEYQVNEEERMYLTVRMTIEDTLKLLENV